MDLAVNTEHLKKVISCASRAVSNKAIQPILNNILLLCENGSLIISATDLDLAIECKLPASVSVPGKITLPAKKLDEIVNKVPGEDVNIEIDKNQLAKILSNKSRFQINGVTGEDFPEIIKKSNIEKTYSIKQEELLQAISLTSFATSKFEITSILSGVKFEVSEEEYEIGATDGSRLARYVGSLESSAKVKQSVVIPWRAINELEKLITTFREGNETISFYFLPGQIIFTSNDFTLSTRLLNGTFPTYEKLIPKKQSNKALFSRALLLEAIERVAVLSNERTSVVKLSFFKGSNIVKLDASSPDYGNATDEVEVNYSGNDLEIAFNYRYLSEVLRKIQINEVHLELETPLSPILLNINEKVDYNYTYLIMPVQLR